MYPLGKPSQRISILTLNVQHGVNGNFCMSFGGKIMTNFYCHKEAVFVCFQNNNGMHSRGLSEEEWRPLPVISDTIFLKISFKASFLYPYNWVSMSYLKFAQLEN